MTARACRTAVTRGTYRAAMTFPTHETDDSPAQDDLVVLLLEVAIAVTFTVIVGLAVFWVLPVTS